MNLHPALFLDRDGIINVDHAYVYQQEYFEFIEGIFDLCRAAKQLDYLVFVVTNQAGIGRGYYTEQDFLSVTEWMCDVFRSKGVTIDKVYFCPSHPRYGLGEYRIDSPYRKPNPGMILQAAKEFRVDLEKSLLVGDKQSDMQAGIAAGIGCNLLYSTNDSVSEILSDKIITISSLIQAIPYLANATTSRK